MKAPETLIQTILDAARDEVARRYGYDSWTGEVNGMLTHLSNEERILQRKEEAVPLAMEKQAEFFRWVSKEHQWSDEHGKFSNIFEFKDLKTELELYEIFTTQQ